MRKRLPRPLLAQHRFWTVFMYGDSLTLCTMHRTKPLAEKACDECERGGGAQHWIISVRNHARRTK